MLNLLCMMVLLLKKIKENNYLGALIVYMGYETLIPKVNVVISILILIIFILIGIIFDMIGVAVQSSNEAPFHSMNSRKVKGADLAVKLKKVVIKHQHFVMML